MLQLEEEEHAEDYKNFLNEVQAAMRMLRLTNYRHRSKLIAAAAAAAWHL